MVGRIEKSLAVELLNRSFLIGYLCYQPSESQTIRPDS